VRGGEPQMGWGGFEEAAPPPEHCKLGNAKLLAPLYFGDGCVGHSGLYAIINGIRLAIADRHVLTGPELDAVMRSGLRFMSGRLTPEQATLCGLRVSLWRQLAHAMAEATLRRTGLLVRAERLFVAERGTQAAFDTIEQAILSWRVPMLLFRGGHYSVVSGFTRSSLLLFDSSGACSIRKSVCGVAGECEKARHILYPGSFLAIIS